MIIPEKLIGPLAPLASQVGGMGVLERLPFLTLMMAVTHDDDVVGVTFLESEFELTNIDPVSGYVTYDRHFREMYSKTDLEDGAWGIHKEERVWLTQANLGDWVYVRYFMRDGSERIILVIKV